MRYALQRILQFLIVFFLVTFGVMVLLRLGLNKPGDPARTMLGGAPVRAADRPTTTEHYHLDSNYFVQYWYWLTAMLQGRLRLLGPEQPARQHAHRHPDHDDRAPRRLRRDLRPAHRRARRRVPGLPPGPGVRQGLQRLLVHPRLRAGDRDRRVPQLPVRRQARLVPADRREGLPVGRSRGALPQLLPPDARARAPARRGDGADPARRHVAHAAERLHQPGPGQGHVPAPDPLASRAARTRCSRCSPRSASSSARSSAGRSSPRSSSTSTAWARCSSSRRSAATCSRSRRSWRCSSITVVIANLIIDLLYSVIDPRIRVARALGMSAETFNVAPTDTVDARAVVERRHRRRRHRGGGGWPSVGAMFGMAWLLRPDVPRRVRRPAAVHLRLRADGEGRRRAGQPLRPRPGLDRVVRHRRPRQGRLRQVHLRGPDVAVRRRRSRRSSVSSSAG